MRLPFSLLASAVLALAACNQTEGGTESAEEFAQRVNGSGTQTAPNAGTPTPAATYTPPPNDAPGPLVPGTGSDPKASKCGATKVGEFYGQAASPQIRGAIMQAVLPNSNVRFVEPGTNVVPDANSDRLNIMIDVTGVIRDARCG